MPHNSDKNLSAEEIIRSFEAELQHQDDLVYGVALFFECMTLLHMDNPGIVETHRKQFRNVVQRGREMIQEAATLLEDAKRDHTKSEVLTRVEFTPCEGHPQPREMSRRAGLLVTSYKKLFPKRPRDKDLAAPEILKLIEDASAKMSF